MKKDVPVAVVVGLALVIVAAVAAYMLLIHPVRAESGRLDEQIAALKTEVDAALTAKGTRPSAAVRVADLLALSKAMPDEEDMPGIILELDAVASAVGVEFTQISPQPAVPKEGYRVVPISLTFEGNYYDLTDLLFRLRNVVAVRDGELAATGRLFTLDTLDMHASDEGFPDIEAALTVSTYVYDAAAAAPSPATPTTTATDGSQQAAGGTP